MTSEEHVVLVHTRESHQSMNYSGFDRNIKAIAVGGNFIFISSSNKSLVSRVVECQQSSQPVPDAENDLLVSPESFSKLLS